MSRDINAQITYYNQFESNCKFYRWRNRDHLANELVIIKIKLK